DKLVTGVQTCALPILCPDPVAAQVRRLAAAPAPVDDGRFVVVGRRHLRTNNSWMHNVPTLVKGRELCTLVVNRADAARLGLVAEIGRASCRERGWTTA